MDNFSCNYCGGTECYSLGSLGAGNWVRCRNCGMDAQVDSEGFVIDLTHDVPDDGYMADCEDDERIEEPSYMAEFEEDS